MKFEINKEIIELWVAHLRSITTVCCTLIVAIFAVFQFADNQPNYKVLAAISIGLFLFSIIGSVLAQMLLINVDVIGGKQLKPSLQRTLVQSLFLANIGFLLAVLCLAIFGIANVF